MGKYASYLPVVCKWLSRLCTTWIRADISLNAVLKPDRSIYFKYSILSLGYGFALKVRKDWAATLQVWLHQDDKVKVEGKGQHQINIKGRPGQIHSMSHVAPPTITSGPLDNLITSVPKKWYHGQRGNLCLLFFLADSKSTGLVTMETELNEIPWLMTPSWPSLNHARNLTKGLQTSTLTSEL